MISPAQQQLDEALTAGGHSDDCAAFEGHRCPGAPGCHGNPVAEELYAAVGAERAAEVKKQPRLVSEVKPRVDGVIDVTGDGRENAIRREIAAALPGSVTLMGGAAAAFERYREAARDLKAATELYQGAQRKYQEAHQAFADAIAGS